MVFNNAGDVMYGGELICTISNEKGWVLPYLPLYNARPCIIHTPILDCALKKKKKEAENRGSGYAKLA